MNEIIAVLKEETQRQKDWVNSKRKAVDVWFSKNGYDYSKTLPKNYDIPKPMRDKAMAWYKVLFVIGLIIALTF